MKQTLRNLILRLLWRGVARKVQAERPRIIAVTGSIGKTSTKEALALVLAQSGRSVLKTEGNLGTDTGVPISLLGFEEPPGDFIGWLPVLWKAAFPPISAFTQPPYYVLEYASDKPGDIKFLTDRLAPQVGVMATVAPVHLQAFSDLEALVNEELAVSTGLAASGILVANADDSYQKRLAQSGVSIRWYGMSNVTVTPTPKGLSFELDGTIYQTQLIGRHQIYPLLAAIATGSAEGISAQLLVKAVAQYQVPPGRGRLLEGRDGISLIDDSYNSSPEATKAALQMLKEFAGTRRSVAVLGRMNELGEHSLPLHFELGKEAAIADLLIFVGEYAEEMKRGAIEAGKAVQSILTFSTPEACFVEIDPVLKPGDVILVKASQNGMRLERLVKLLLKDPAHSSQLVRQSLYWQQHP